jgi:hypothetical protein
MMHEWSMNSSVIDGFILSGSPSISNGFFKQSAADQGP